MVPGVVKEHTALILKGQVVSERSYHLASNAVSLSPILESSSRKNVFETGCMAAWLFEGELSSGHAELSSVMHSVRELR